MKDTQNTEKKITYRCRHCGVQVLSKTNKRAVLGKTHSCKCPRRFL